MGRKPKYSTDEERENGNRQYAKNYYQTHKDKILSIQRVRSRRDWYRKQLKAHPDNEKYQQQLQQLNEQLDSLQQEKKKKKSVTINVPVDPLPTTPEEEIELCKMLDEKHNVKIKIKIEFENIISNQDEARQCQSLSGELNESEE